MKKQSEMPLLIITGACGFIGSAFVRYLNDKNIDNLLLVDDIKHSEKWKNLVGKRFKDLISRYDLPKFLQENSQEIAAIVHLGACSDTMQTDGDYLLKNNTRYSIALAEFALFHEIPFVYASSAATYGNGATGFQDDEKKLDTLHPLNLYGFSKHLFDLWLYRQKVLDKVFGLKYFNVFGPNEYHKEKMMSWVCKMTYDVQKTKKVTLFKSYDPQYKDGEQCRDFIYVKDAVAMTYDLLQGAMQGSSGGIFNIGSAKASTWNALATALFHALQQPVNISYVDMPENLKNQYQYYTCADMSKYIHFSKEKLHKSFSVHSLDDAVKDYVQNYLLKNARW